MPLGAQCFAWLLACACPPQRAVARPPTETRQKRFTPRGYPSLACHSGPPEPRAPWASQRRPEHRPERQLQHRVREEGVATGTPTSVSSFSRPVPAALRATSLTSTTTIGRLAPSPVDRVDHSNRVNNHPQDRSIEGNERQW